MHTEFINRLIELVEANLANETFGIEDISREMGMSHSSLHRKLKSISNQNISQFIREVRLKKAKELLLNDDLTVAEISYLVGFGSPTYFNKCFHEYFGCTPGDWKNHVKLNESNEQRIEIQFDSNKNWIKPKGLYALLIVIISVILLFLFFEPISGSRSNLDKTIAVLPFVDFSKDKGYTYIINGLREEICNNLEIIKDLKVKSRLDAEKFRDSGLSAQEIAKKLKVKYILTGSGQEVDAKIRFRLQLVETASGNNIWWNAYSTELTELTTKNIFEIQEETAIDVAYLIKEILVPKENDPLSYLPDDSLTPEKLYAKGIKCMDFSSHLYFGDLADIELFKAKKMFEQAVKMDSAFADAFASLGAIYSDHLYYTPDINLSEKYLDSAFYMANKAYQLDHRINTAKRVRADYYLRKGMTKEFFEAHKEYDNDMDTSEDWFEFGMYTTLQDSYHAIISFLKMWERGSLMPWTERQVLKCFSEMGYPEISRKYADQILGETSDSLAYYYDLLDINLLTGNFREAVNYGLICAEMDNRDIPEGNLALTVFYLRDFSKAYQYLQKVKNPYQLRNWIVPDINMGFIYLKNGLKKEANSFLNNAEKNCLLEIEYNRINAQNFYSQFYLACIYSVRGEKEKALKNLKLLKKRETNPLWLVIDLKQSPYFDNIRHESAFADVLKDVETKYQQVHLLVGELIKKKDFPDGGR